MRFWVCSILLVCVLVLLVLLALHSEILRDLGPVPPKDPTQSWWRQTHKPYSLARFQMAFWFFLVIASFLFIWQITGASEIITGSVLGLIGIGAGTALGAAAIDAGKSAGNNSQLSSLKAELVTLQHEMTALDTQLTAAPPPSNKVELEHQKTAKQTRLNLITDQMTALSTAVGPKASDGFLNDILTDDANGISFHRFQVFIWTLVLGILFVYSVWNRLSMPEFSATLLALMGSSSGTYLGFKIPEKQT